MPLSATRITLRHLARRHLALTEEIGELDGQIAPLAAAAAAQLLDLFGVGPEIAGQLLTTAGNNPERLPSEAVLAHLSGIAPIPASSGRTHRHRLNRVGDCGANRALHTIVLSRMHYDPRTRAYVARRTARSTQARGAGVWGEAAVTASLPRRGTSGAPTECGRHSDREQPGQAAGRRCATLDGA